VNVSDDNMIRCDAENRNTRDVLFTRDDIKYETVLAMKLKSMYCSKLLIYCDRGQREIV